MRLHYLHAPDSFWGETSKKLYFTARVSMWEMPNLNSKCDYICVAPENQNGVYLKGAGILSIKNAQKI